MEHKIKIKRVFASQHLRGEKQWELRKNDRNYKVGDIIIFTSIAEKEGQETVIYRREIISVYPGGNYGLEEGYVILTLGLRK